MLEAVPWENPMYGISGGAAGNVAYGGTVNPPRNRKGGAGNPPPKGARASALPNAMEQMAPDVIAAADTISDAMGGGEPRVERKSRRRQR